MAIHEQTSAHHAAKHLALNNIYNMCYLCTVFGTA